MTVMDGLPLLQQIHAVWTLEVLLPLGHDEVSQHVEGVAVWMHRHNPAALLVDLQEPGIIKAHDRRLRPLAAAQADLLATANEAQHQVTGGNGRWEDLAP